jgi:hypothetical protein
LEALERLLSELAKALELRLACEKSRMPKAGRRTETEKDFLVMRLHKLWTQGLCRKARGTPGGPFVGFVNAVFKELGWGENNERRVQKSLPQPQLVKAAFRDL